ncbi:diguanylate cyclase/phosphodiesterase (GGDEF & EAL domain) with PAS/PAC sensor(s) [Geobacillus stearothermophilus]|nr:diguanylate cyclase/phosphodiesterase (GGDEF & EAL domain) with PAS/PAC sensor(s) [Geobacillus stearothermophilus]
MEDVCHSREFFKHMWKTIGTGKIWRREIKNKAKDGSYYWVQSTIVPFLDERGKPYQYVSIRTDITRLKQYEEQIKYMANHDDLTGLPNRRFLTFFVFAGHCIRLSSDRTTPIKDP